MDSGVFEIKGCLFLLERGNTHFTSKPVPCALLLGESGHKCLILSLLF